MVFEDYKAKLMKRLEKYFSLTESVALAHHTVDLRAHHEGIYGRTFISKVDVIDQYRDEEEHLLKYFGEGSLSEMKAYMESVEKQVQSRMLPQAHHASQVVVSLVTDGSNHEIKQYVERYKWHKSHWLGLKGWTDIHIVYIALDTKEVYTSKKAKEMQQVYAL